MKTKTLADFKGSFDPDVVIPRKIKDALAAMLKDGPEHWEFEVDLIKRTGISVVQFARYREQFVAHVVEVQEANRAPRRVWFADPKVAAKARGG